MVKVLIAVDPSEQAEKAFNWYSNTFYKDDHEVLILHVGETPKLPTFTFSEAGSFPADEIQRILTENNKKLNELENHYGTMARQCKIAKFKVLMASGESGRPGEEIVNTAKNNQADVIVMGSRGLNLIRRTVLGSVSDYVLHHSKLPVLIVPRE